MVVTAVIAVAPMASTAWSAQTTPTDTCVQDLGTLDATTTSASGSGIIAVDASCTSSLRDPDSTSTFFARRHTFTLAEAATVSVSVDDRSPGSVRTYLVLSDSSGVVLGRAAGDSRFRNSRLDYLLLQSGTYTVEATTYSAQATGGYRVDVQRWAADACVRDLGSLDSTSTVASGSGIIAQDASCTSSLRDPDSTSTFFVRRHTFTLAEAATVSVSVGPSSSRSFLVLSDSSGTEVGRDQGRDSSCSRGRCTSSEPARLDRLLLAAGTFTVEATTGDAAATGAYRVSVSWAPVYEPLSVVLVDASSVELVYDVALDAASVPPVGAFGVSAAGVSHAVGAVSVVGQVVTLSLASPVLQSQGVVVSYAVPTAAGARRLEAVSGAAAVGFAARAALVPPNAPVITAVESSASDGLMVSWAGVAGSTGYELRWRRSGEQVWQSARVGAVQEFTISGLVRGALYGVQVRAVKTGGDSGQRLYVTVWSGSSSGIAGGWTPADVTVVPADRALVVSWSDVPAAAGFEVLYWPSGDFSDRRRVPAVRDGDGWRADAAGLIDGESYGVAVRSVRTVAADPVLFPGGQETVRSAWVTTFAVAGTFLGGRMSTYSSVGVIFQRIRGARYSVWWGGGCEGDFVLWDRRTAADVWSRVNGLTHFDDGAGTYRLTEPDLGFRTTNAPSAFQDILRRVEGRRLQLRCSPAAGALPTTAERPPGRLLGEVVFRRSGGNSPQAPPNVGAVGYFGGELVVSWDGFTEAELARIRSSVVGYELQWRWFDDDGTEHTSTAGAISPLHRSHTIQDLVPGRAYDVRVRATSSTHDGAWSPYVSVSAPQSASLDYDFPQGFTVDVEAGSTRVGRGGHYSVVVLRLADPAGSTELSHIGLPVPADAPLADAAVRVSISAGPSAGQEVICVNTSGSGDAPASAAPCTTTKTGHLALYYQVPLAGVDADRMQHDVLLVHHDTDGDGTLNTRHTSSGIPYDAEPARRVVLPVAKAANYIALGDSYSSGENGDNPESGTYQDGVSDADGECRRWDLAYPYIFNDDFLKNRELRELNVDVTFKTFACTGAETLHIYDPADPNPTPPPGEAHDTDRPSPHAQFGEPVYRPARPGADRELLHERHPRWEPRQAASLADVEAMRDVDMVTLTIGGNDAEFAAKIRDCALVHECNPTVSAARLEQIEQMVVDVLERVKLAAPDAAVFVLGYPHLTPEVDPCANPQEIEHPRSGTQIIELDFSALPDGCEASWDMYFDAVDSCDTLSAAGVVRGSGGYIIGVPLQAALGDDRTRIDYREAKAIWSVADQLNARLASAAMSARVHFVDVVGGVPLDDAPRGFVGHSSCNRSDPWMNGFVVKSSRLPAVDGKDDSSFHPTAEGQDAYARILEEYIRVQIKVGAALNSAGLPVTPVPLSPESSSGHTGHGARGSADSSQRSTKGRGDSAVAEGVVAGGSGQPRSSVQPVGSHGLLLARPASDVSGCGAPFVSPGEQVTLTAAGFASNAMVSFTAQAISLGSAQLTAPQIAAAAADADGAITVVWTVPAAPGATVDAASRALIVDASGLNDSGGTHSARMGLPLVVYPATASCAKADAASTTLGASVRVVVLANDIAPTGGSLDAASVQVRAARGGSFTVDSTTGAVTFTPDAGFWGTVESSYVVYDNWGIGTEAALTISVDAGCTVTGTAGTVRIVGTDGDDVICVPDRDDRRAFHVIDAKAGNDIVLGGAGVDLVYAGAGADTVYAGGGSDHIDGGAGADVVYGGSGFDTVYSTDLADTIHDDPDGSELVVAPAAVVEHTAPVASADWHHVDVSAVAGIDVLGNDYDPNDNLDASTLRIAREASSGTARVVLLGDGGAVVEYTAPATAGTDSFAYEVCDRVGACPSAEVTVLVGASGCTIVGTDAADTLFGTAGDDVICGLGGDDIIYGLGGGDIIVGGTGDDRIYGGDATLVGATDGDDLLWGGAGDDTLYGGNGTDTLYGGDGNDTLHGNRRDDRIYGGSGDDTAVGGGENDAIFGGSGDDTLDGHAGDDTVHGGPGVDSLRGGNGDDTLYGGPGADTLTGGAGADTLYGGSGDDDLDGNTQDDTLHGGSGDDTLDGQGHNDEVHGDAGDDTIRGGAGNDRAYGGAGDDSLDGGNGTDYLNGGPDTDTCTRAQTTTRCELEGRNS